MVHVELFDARELLAEGRLEIGLLVDVTWRASEVTPVALVIVKLHLPGHLHVALRSATHYSHRHK